LGLEEEKKVKKKFRRETYSMAAKQAGEHRESLTLIGDAKEDLLGDLQFEAVCAEERIWKLGCGDHQTTPRERKKQKRK